MHVIKWNSFNGEFQFKFYLDNPFVDMSPPPNNASLKACVSVGVYESLVKCSGVTGQAGWCHSSDLLLHYCRVTGQVQL